MKYNVELELATKNSQTLIADQISYGSTVLEFGPANGRLTKHLQEVLGCRVYIVEMDEESGKQAAKYAEGCFIGDIEKYEWVETFSDTSFDYAIFADVLEHLREPEKALRTVRFLMKEAGSILISVPNMNHNSILIELLNNKFEYKETGLLDNTHIHFFTKDSLDKMLDDCGYVVYYRNAVYYDTERTEFNNTISDVQGVERSFFTKRKFGNVYQFIYGAKVNTEHFMGEQSSLINYPLCYHAQMFYDEGTGFSRDNTVVKLINPAEQSIVRLEFPVSGDTELQQIRFDPLDKNCIIDIKEMKIALKNGQDIPLEISCSNAAMATDNHYCFSDPDPQIYFKHIQLSDKIDKLIIELNYKFYDSSIVDDIISYIGIHTRSHSEIIKILDNNLKSAEEQKVRLLEEIDAFAVESNAHNENNKKLLEENHNLAELLATNNENNKKLLVENQNLTKLLVASENKYQEDMLSVVNMSNGEIDLVKANYHNELSNARAHSEELRKTVDELKKSTSWKITRPLRMVSLLFRRK